MFAHHKNHKNEPAGFLVLAQILLILAQPVF